MDLSFLLRKQLRNQLGSWLMNDEAFVPCRLLRDIKTQVSWIEFQNDMDLSFPLCKPIDIFQVMQGRQSAEDPRHRRRGLHRQLAAERAGSKEQRRPRRRERQVPGGAQLVGGGHHRIGCWARLAFVVPLQEDRDVKKKMK